MENNSKIKCPNCHHEIDVQDVLVQQVEERLRLDFQQKLNTEQEKIRQEEEKLKKSQEEFEEKKRKENELFKERIETKLKEEKAEYEQKIRARVNEEQEEQYKELQNELNEKSEKLKELSRSKAEIEKLKREKNELKEEIEAESQKKLSELLVAEKEKIRKVFQDQNELTIKELKKQLEDQKKLTEEMKRKQEQGSMQLQGEAQELAIEERLQKTYPFDNIDEVPKGVRGADCIQTVINSSQQTCGSIVYESKRTKNFSNDWIDKLKQDQLNCKANLAVLVTQAFPQGMDRFGEKDGIWICGFHELNSLSFVLREMIIKTHSVAISQENKGDKMGLLYDYLTSNEFVQNIKRIVENYDAMIDQLNTEKKATHKMWAQREKQIWVVQENIASLFGSIKGIAGKELETASVLELPEKSIEK